MTITGGTISGNYAAENGGGIYNNRTVNMRGGSISDNEAGKIGGGVYNVDKYLLLVADAEIINNKAGENAGGVWFFKNGFLALEGKVTITGNKVGDKDNNVWLPNGAAISITSKFSKETQAGVSSEVKPEAGAPINVTKTNKGRSNASCFVSDDPTYGIFQDGTDEVLLVVPITITFKPGHDKATGEMAPLIVGSGTAFSAPTEAPEIALMRVSHPSSHKARHTPT